MSECQRSGVQLKNIGFTESAEWARAPRQQSSGRLAAAAAQIQVSLRTSDHVRLVEVAASDITSSASVRWCTAMDFGRQNTASLRSPLREK